MIILASHESTGLSAIGTELRRGLIIGSHILVQGAHNFGLAFIP